MITLGVTLLTTCGSARTEQLLHNSQAAARLRGVKRHGIDVLDQLHGELAAVKLDAVAAGRDRQHVAIMQLPRHRVPRSHALAHLPPSPPAQLQI